MTYCHTTRDGQRIPISEMGDRHLLNTIALIERKARKGIVVRYGGGSWPDDYWYDEDHLARESALEYLNHGKYLKEARHRGLIQ